MARCCGAGPTISALSAPRIQAGRVNGSECTFSKPPAFSLASAHATARLWASVPARRCPISVVSDSTKAKEARSSSAFCPRLEAVTASDSSGFAADAFTTPPVEARAIDRVVIHNILAMAS